MADFCRGSEIFVDGVLIVIAQLVGGGDGSDAFLEVEAGDGGAAALALPLSCFCCLTAGCSSFIVACSGRLHHLSAECCRSGDLHLWIGRLLIRVPHRCDSCG